MSDEDKKEMLALINRDPVLLSLLYDLDLLPEQIDDELSSEWFRMTCIALHFGRATLSRDDEIKALKESLVQVASALEPHWRGASPVGAFPTAKWIIDEYRSHLKATRDEYAEELAQSQARCKELEALSVEVSQNLHPQTRLLVERFAFALACKLRKAEQKYGYSNGWLSKDWMPECRRKLREHLVKGDPRDVAAYCAFLWHHGESTFAKDEGRDIEEENKFLHDALDAFNWQRINAMSHEEVHKELLAAGYTEERLAEGLAKIRKTAEEALAKLAARQTLNPESK